MGNAAGMGFTLIQQVWDPIARKYVEDELSFTDALPSWLVERLDALQSAFPGSEWVSDLESGSEASSAA